MSPKTTLVLLFTALWFLFCHYRYTCVHMQSCWGCADDSAIAGSKEEAYPALTFQPGSDSTITNQKFSSLKDSILTGNTKDNILEITGYYHSDEKAPEGFENMGLARATRAQELLTDDIKQQRIRIKSKLIQKDASLDRFSATDFNWKAVDIKKSEVVKTADGANIYFPYNSAKKEVDPAIDQYLNQVADRIKASGEKVSLTGHTDDRGTADYNKNLGMDRANSIRSILIKYGVAKNQITTESRGKETPFTTNETEEGRHQNRRVELKISQ